MKLTPLAAIRTSACFGTGRGLGDLHQLHRFGAAGLFHLNGFHSLNLFATRRRACTVVA